MTQTEHDELRAELAELAGPGSVPEPGFVDASRAWERGTRWGRRRRRVAAASTALCLVVLGALAWGLPHSLPAGDEAPLAAQSTGVGVAQIPSRLWDTPSRASQIGWGAPVVAVQEAPRWGWFGSDPGIAVRTGDGRQGFVVADDYAGGVTVSPDGRRIAYWITGETSGTPNTSGGQAVTVTGIAVRDVVDGSLRIHDFASPHGVSTSTLYFAADALLVADVGAWRAGDDGDDMARSSAEADQGLVWDVAGDAEPTPWTELFGDDVAVPGAHFSWAREGRVFALGGSTLGPGFGFQAVEEYDLRSGEVAPVAYAIGNWPESGSGTPNVVADHDGGFYLLGDGRGTQNPNEVAAVARSAEFSDFLEKPRVLEGSDGTLGFFGVRDGAVLVSRIAEKTEMVTADTLQDVVAMWAEGEVRTMEVLVDVQSEGDTEHGRWQWATDLLESVPLTEASEPESPVSPWVWIAGGVGVFVTALGGVAVWWRRAQP